MAFVSSRVRRQSLWDRIWQRRARQLWKKTERHGLSGALDEPRPGQRFVHGFKLRGWVASPNVLRALNSRHNPTQATLATDS